jgi:hypothetical protein
VLGAGLSHDKLLRRCELPVPACEDDWCGSKGQIFNESCWLEQLIADVWLLLVQLVAPARCDPFFAT